MVAGFETGRRGVDTRDSVRGLGLMGLATLEVSQEVLPVIPFFDQSE